MLNLGNIRAISLDLDDTLWPIWPTIERAEKALQTWLQTHAPRTAARYSTPLALRELRAFMGEHRPDLQHDMSALRRESIRLGLTRSDEDPALAEPAFEVFFAERQNVILFPDALPALKFLGARFPMVSLSNGNADLERVGLAGYFQAAFSAREFGVGKPDPRIFHAAARALEVQPHEVLHIGDDAALDVIGGLGAGMQTAWLNRQGQPWPHDDPRPHLDFSHFDALCDALRSVPVRPVVR